MPLFGKNKQSKRIPSISDETSLSDAGPNTTIPIESTKKDIGPKRYLPGGKLPTQDSRALLGPLFGFVILMVINVAIPLGLYYGLRNKIGVIYALIISGAPSILYVIYGIIRTGRLDVLGFVIGLSFILSGVVSVISGDERAALIRDSAVAAIIGGLFLLTLIPLRTKFLDNRPLTFKLAQGMLTNIKYSWIDRDGNPQEQDIMLWQWEHIRFFRISQYAQTAAWGFILIMELVACVLMVEVSDLSVDQIVMYNNIINACAISVMVTVSIVLGYYGGRLEQKIGKEWTAENDFSDEYDSEGAGLQRSHTTRTNDDTNV
ncbi:hypothetical protein BJV82DRAFT_671829 [Fennellomyces sp. T-0311]|nr:hypothetical protein BJV82DRAFT_671829 [Fennellomyces sp. T-0311]